jgi:DNA-binding transcriptional ArsR family regulator
MLRDDQLSRTFEALAAPTRRAILARLSRGPATVGELAAPFDMSLPAVSRHLKVLEAAGLIRRERRAQWRRCHLEPSALAEAGRWIEQHHAFWQARFDALARYLETTQGKDESDDRDEPANEP